ncbi:acetylornithine aminotransferase apoenzyme; N2-acetyl-L-lysine aminotransferase apoenzyme [Ignisphaera aggregans DSM 17230]|uniref:Putative [LysW]-aminoadipate semialdehyde/glutamate semialdehyde transaminase n=1 Tax=Ignisphaera aggregans (strain DSM 17230 / JCM 13409 / AQ1.S1) TaxID=583356 RepID=E0SS91_IGNAA|nr:acetylornithine aminotransferase apoenzyme; N2-acetyl-L-lysine aminotransferase apoenzyme [Ignisphaera aggregans DSM 17230]
MLKYLMLYEDRGIEIEYAESQYVWDSNGRKYLDMHTGHGVAFLGHRNPHIVNTIVDQMSKVMTLSTSFRVKIREEMLEVLSKVVPDRYEYVYLLNSGSEAVEFALKISRKVTGRKKIIYFTNSFHGRTFGALSVTANQKYRKGFEPLLPETMMLRYNDLSEIDKAVDEQTAAVILELIQGEGGINVASEEFVSELRRRTMDVGAILIIDEIQTGFGRTGSIWLSEQYGVYPDILLAGKAIGGGFPVSVIFMPHDIGVKIERGSHGSTYGGNPLACAAVKASTEVLINDSVPQKAYEKGNMFFELLRRELKDIRIVREIRGAGLMIGIDLRIEPTNIIKELQNEGILALKSGTTVLRLLPPYVITNIDIEYAVKVIARTIASQISS